MIVRADDQRGVFWVQSSSDPNQDHMVDLVANGGRGQCACDSWKFRMSPRILAGQKGPDVWCSHIIAARKSLVAGYDMNHRDEQKVINGVIDQWLQQERPSKTEVPTIPLFGSGSGSDCP